jgi:hypothetical protein
MANSGSEQFWTVILPARRPLCRIDRGAPRRGVQVGPGAASFIRNFASTAGGTSEDTLPP